MSLSFVIIRAVLGIIFFILGVFAGQQAFKGIVILGDPNAVYSLTGLVLGIFGVFVIPFITERVRHWQETVIKTTVVKSMTEVTKQVVRAVESSRKPEEKEEKKEKTDDSSRFMEGRQKVEPKPVILDTSAIIDGRLLEIVECGFLDGVLLVPEGVLDELRRLADSADDLKRQRGRRGLEVLEELKANEDVRLDVIGGVRQGKENGEVDRELINLAKKRHAKIATVDFNLNKSASVSGIKVLNVNELANAIKTVVLPGESMTIKIVQKGKEVGQGVGYLSDGTMVVVEQGEALLGQETIVQVSRVIQTAAGKMIFTALQPPPKTTG